MLFTIQFKDNISVQKTTVQTKMSKLGFGLMRLPENNGVIDHEQVCNMVENLYRANKYVITAADQAP